MDEVDQTETQDRPATQARRPRRSRIGVVESDIRDKTIRVRIDQLTKHPKYGKYLRHRSVVHAHDAKNEARRGDVVQIMECRPISKSKSWRLSRIVRKFGES